MARKEKDLDTLINLLIFNIVGLAVSVFILGLALGLYLGCR